MDKINAMDMTFLFLVKFDSVERMENALVSIDYILENLETNIEVMEVSSNTFSIFEKLLPTYPHLRCTHVIDYDDVLFRTKYLNHMLNHVKTEFVGVWDADVIIPYSQVVDGIKDLRSGNVDMVYPYGKEFLDVPYILRSIFLDERDVSFLRQNKNKMKRIYGEHPVGGAYMCRLSSYRQIGLENESYYGWGREDGDRYYRWLHSKFKMKRIEGELYHLCHPRGENSIFSSYTLRNSKFKLVNEQRISTYNKSLRVRYDEYTNRNPNRNG